MNSRAGSAEEGTFANSSRAYLPIKPVKCDDPQPVKQILWKALPLKALATPLRHLPPDIAVSLTAAGSSRISCSI